MYTFHKDIPKIVILILVQIYLFHKIQSLNKLTSQQKNALISENVSLIANIM